MSISTTETWRQLLNDLLRTGDPIAPREQRTWELLGCQTRVDMNFPVVTCSHRKLGLRFMAAEAAWILSGSNRVSDIAPFAPSIGKFSDDGLTFFGAYGPRFVDQVAHATKVLEADPATRQAVVTFWRPNPRLTRDVPCTVALQWLLREGRLNCVTTMRSSDAWLGWPYDVFSFSMMSARVLLGLRHVNLSKWQGVKLGDLRLTAGSQHLYLRNVERAETCVKSASGHYRFTYTPFTSEQFAHPDELTEHLWCLARNQDLEHGWLREVNGVTGPEDSTDG